MLVHGPANKSLSHKTSDVRQTHCLLPSCSESSQNRTEPKLTMSALGHTVHCVLQMNVHNATAGTVPVTQYTHALLQCKAMRHKKPSEWILTAQVPPYSLQLLLAGLRSNKAHISIMQYVRRIQVIPREHRKRERERMCVCVCVCATHITNRHKRCLVKIRTEYFVRFTF